MLARVELRVGIAATVSVAVAGLSGLSLLFTHAQEVVRTSETMQAEHVAHGLSEYGQSDNGPWRAWLLSHIVFAVRSTEVVVAPSHQVQLVVDPGPWGTEHHVSVHDVAASSLLERVDLHEPNRDGRFVFEHLEPGLEHVTLMPRHGSREFFRPAPIEVDLQPGAVRHVGFTRSPSTFTIRGRVRYEDGSIDARVPVRVHHVRAANAARPGVRTTNTRSGGCTVSTREDGTFEISGIDGTAVCLTPHPYGTLGDRNDLPTLAQPPPRIELYFDANTPPIGELGDFVLVRARPVQIHGSVSLADLPPRTVTGFIASSNPATSIPAAATSRRIGWPVRILADGTFSRMVEGNLIGGVVWLELHDAWTMRRIGPIALVVSGQSSVDVGLLEW